MANPKLGAKSVPGVACYPLVTHKKFSNKFWGSHNWCPWTHILDSHIGQSYWTVIMTVLFFIVPVQYDCPVCEMCLNKPSSSHKNVRPLFIVKIWILGYNVRNPLSFACCQWMQYIGAFFESSSLYFELRQRHMVRGIKGKALFAQCLQTCGGTGPNLETRVKTVRTVLRERQANIAQVTC